MTLLRLIGFAGQADVRRRRARLRHAEAGLRCGKQRTDE